MTQLQECVSTDCGTCKPAPILVTYRVASSYNIDRHYRTQRCGPFTPLAGKSTSAFVRLTGLDSAAEPATSRIYAANAAAFDWLLPLLLIVGAARLLSPSWVPMAIGGAVGYTAYRGDPTYRCAVATEAGGVAFSLAVIVILLRQRQSRHAAPATENAVLVGAATAVLVFHLVYTVEKNALGLRA